jgi:uncharacterized protein (DUF433 family)
MDSESEIGLGQLVGVGLYTPIEASRLTQISSGKIVRWLRGHERDGRHYDALWKPELDLGNEGLFLNFRDLMEVRIAAAFIASGLSPQRVRAAILLAKEMIDDDRPLSTTWFRTDGRSVFLTVIEKDGQTKLIDLFRRQFAFREIVERSLRNIDYSIEGVPRRWWPLGKKAAIVIDPERSFGRPIETDSSVPADILAAAVDAEGSIDAVVTAWDVSAKSVRRAVHFRDEMNRRKAA